MRIFLAGGTGVLGSRLVPALVAAGHQVTATTRQADRAHAMRDAGATPVVLDALDGEAVHAAVAAAQPEVVLHQLTAITGGESLKNLDAGYARTNQLRTTGLDHLLAAAQAVSAKRFIAQSFAGWPNARTGERVKTEDDPLDPTPSVGARHTHAAITHAETTTLAAEGLDGLVLRYGLLYGPGTMVGAGGGMLASIAKRAMPVVGGGTGVWSLVHADDAASASVAAIERGAPGIYNVVDDEPAAVADWLPYLATVLGAKPPRRVPAWLVKPMLGEHGIAMMTSIRGSANAKAKRELDWTLRYPSWRQGFRHGLES